MPVSVTNSRLIYDALKACDVKIMSALPETWLVHLIRMADEDPDMMLVRLAKEEEGIGISAGAHMAGVNSAMLMQNHGFLAAINGIVSLALLYKIPLRRHGHRANSTRFEHPHLAFDRLQRYLPPSQRCANPGLRLAAPGCRFAVTRTNVGGMIDHAARRCIEDYLS